MQKKVKNLASPLSLISLVPSLPDVTIFISFVYFDHSFFKYSLIPFANSLFFLI